MHFFHVCRLPLILTVFFLGFSKEYFVIFGRMVLSSGCVDVYGLRVVPLLEGEPVSVPDSDSAGGGSVSVLVVPGGEEVS